MQSCKIIIYSYLPVNAQFKKISKLSKNDRKQAASLIEYNKFSKNQSLRVRIEKELKKFTDKNYFFAFSHSYTIVLDSETSRLKDSYQFLLFELSSYQLTNKIIIKLDQIGYVRQNPIILKDWQNSASCNLKFQELLFKNNEAPYQLLFHNREYFQDLYIDKSIIGSNYIYGQNSHDYQAKLNNHLINEFKTFNKQDILQLKSVTIQDSVIVNGDFFYKMKDLEQLTSYRTYWSDFTITIIQNLPNLRKLTWINDQDKEIIYLEKYQRSALKFQISLSQITKFQQIKILKLNINNLKNTLDYQEVFLMPNLKRIIFHVLNNNLPISLRNLVCIFKQIETHIQIVFEISSLCLIDENYQIVFRDKPLGNLDFQQILQILSGYFRCKISKIVKETSKTKLTLAVKIDRGANQIIHRIKVRKQIGSQMEPYIYLSQVNMF